MVSLMPGSGDGSINNSLYTYLNYVDFNLTSPTYGDEISAAPYTSTTGTITISPATIPEPASIVSGLIAVLILAGISGARRARRLIVPAR